MVLARFLPRDERFFDYFQDAAKNAQDPDLKDFAQKTLPTLEQHHQMAKDMESSVKQEQP